MGRYFTVMIVPERGKGVRSFKVPGILFKAFSFLFVISLFIGAILAYDYREILKQVYENRHLIVENRQLKKQVQLFNMKINTLARDIERIQTFEKKLRIISGIEQFDMARPLVGEPRREEKQTGGTTQALKETENFKENPKFMNLKSTYEQEVIEAYDDLAVPDERSLLLAGRYAEFDYKFEVLKEQVKGLEVDIHELDQFLLDKDSFLRSTPTLLPTKGWITSYYGPRISPTTNRPKMHEGIDIGANPGTPILSPADGTVTYSGRRPGFGNFIQINHGYGVETIYAHAKTLSVEKGEVVSRGDRLATIGSTGHSTGPHVHYEVRVNGTPVDPLFFILE